MHKIYIKFKIFTIHSGFDGGQRQWFVMEIYDQQNNMLETNVSSKYPIFTVGGLEAGKLLKIVIYAINMRGRSDPILMEAFTLKAAEKAKGKMIFSFNFHIKVFIQMTNLTFSIL